MAKHGTSGGHRQHDATPLREFIQEQWEAWDTVRYNMKEEESVGYRPQGITSRGRKRRASTKIELTPKTIRLTPSVYESNPLNIPSGNLT